jgi:hypothetical protein
VQAGGHQDDLGAGPLGVGEDRLDVAVVAAGHEDQDHVVSIPTEPESQERWGLGSHDAIMAALHAGDLGALVMAVNGPGIEVP